MIRKRLKTILLVSATLSRLCLASEDHLTTDFQEKMQPNPGVQVFYMLKSIIPPGDVDGSSTLQKYGIDVAPSKYFDVYVVEQKFNNDLSRTNRYQYSMSGTNVGFRIHPLREEDHWLGLTVGANWENATPSRIYRNGVDLGIANFDETSSYFSVLLTKPINDKLRVNAGAKFGRSKVGPVEGHSNTYAVGLRYDFTPEFGVQGNYKITDLEGLDKNHNFGLNLMYRPNDNIKLQLNADLYTNGVTGLYPVTEPLIPPNYRQRFGNKAVGALGFTASFALGQGGNSRRVRQRDTLDTPTKEEAPQKSTTEDGQEQSAAPAEPAGAGNWRSENPHFGGTELKQEKVQAPSVKPGVSSWRDDNPYFTGKKLSTADTSATDRPAVQKGDWRAENPYFK